MRHKAIRNLYPQVITIDDTTGCFDSSGAHVTIDEQAVEAEMVRLNLEAASTEYKAKRAAEYPDFKLYLDGVVKGDQTQIQAYVDACIAVKQKYPKPL